MLATCADQYSLKSESDKCELHCFMPPAQKALILPLIVILVLVALIWWFYGDDEIVAIPEPDTQGAVVDPLPPYDPATDIKG